MTSEVSDFRTGDVKNVSGSIASGNSLSSVIDLEGCRLVAIQLPSAMTNANLLFDATLADDDTGATFGPLYNEGVEYSVATGSGSAGSRVIALNPAVFAGVRFLKLRVGTNEGDDRDFKLKTITPY